MDRMRRLAEALEGRAELIVDANQAWDETHIRTLPSRTSGDGRSPRRTAGAGLEYCGNGTTSRASWDAAALG